MSAKKIDAWREITKRTWDDAGFKQKLLMSPESVLEEYGIPREPGVRYRVVQDGPGVRNLVLMQPPGRVAVEEMNSEPLSDENPGF